MSNKEAASKYLDITNPPKVELRVFLPIENKKFFKPKPKDKTSKRELAFDTLKQMKCIEDKFFDSPHRKINPSPLLSDYNRLLLEYDRNYDDLKKNPVKLRKIEAQLKYLRESAKYKRNSASTSKTNSPKKGGNQPKWSDKTIVNSQESSTVPSEKHNLHDVEPKLFKKIKLGDEKSYKDPYLHIHHSGFDQTRDSLEKRRANSSTTHSMTFSETEDDDEYCIIEKEKLKKNT